MPKSRRSPTVPLDQIGQSILIFRGQRVLLDAELASLYGVTTKRLNEQVKRNIERFPADFLFRLNRAETESLNRSQNATGSQKHREETRASARRVAWPDPWERLMAPTAAPLKVTATHDASKMS